MYFRCICAQNALRIRYALLSHSSRQFYSSLRYPSHTAVRLCSAPSFINSRRFFRASQEPQKRDHYEVLGVSKSASQSEIKKAYYKLAKQYHPDTNTDASSKDRFTEVSNSYSVLSDSEKRKLYDQYGHDGEQIHAQGGPTGGAEDVFSTFESFFSGSSSSRSSSRRSGPAPGSNVKIVVDIDFMEAVEGIKKELNFQRKGECKTCSGTGSKSGTRPQVCRQCRGSGMMNVQQGPFIMQVGCDGCNGAGKTSNPCRSCAGSGLMNETVSLSATLPAGIENGTPVRMVNQGNKGTQGGPRGHLLVTPRIAEHSIFHREGSDIHVGVNIPFTTAILGGEVDVPMLRGTATLKVAPGTQHRSKVVMKNKGAPILKRRGQNGHEFVHFSVEVPKASDLSPRQREIMEEFARENEASGAKPSMFRRIKDFMNV